MNKKEFKTHLDRLRKSVDGALQAQKEVLQGEETSQVELDKHVRIVEDTYRHLLFLVELD